MKTLEANNEQTTKYAVILKTLGTNYELNTKPLQQPTTTQRTNTELTIDNYKLTANWLRTYHDLTTSLSQLAAAELRSYYELSTRHVRTNCKGTTNELRTYSEQISNQFWIWFKLDTRNIPTKSAPSSTQLRCDVEPTNASLPSDYERPYNDELITSFSRFHEELTTKYLRTDYEITGNLLHLHYRLITVLMWTNAKRTSDELPPNSELTTQ